MTALTIRLPNSVHQKIKELANQKRRKAAVQSLSII